MKEEYDFSNAERGRFYRPDTQLKPPVYLVPERKVSFLKKHHTQSTIIFSDLA